MRTLSRLFLLLVLLALAVLGPAPVCAQDTGRLNVLFPIAKDLRPELGVTGSPLAKTPQLNALAEAGVRFDRA